MFTAAFPDLPIRPLRWRVIWQRCRKKRRSTIINLTRPKSARGGFRGELTETRGQPLYEWRHLKRKLKKRNPKRHRDLLPVKIPAPYPLFRIVPGRVQDWEKRS